MALTPQGQAALASIRDHRGANVTESINLALVKANYLEERLAAGWEIRVRNPDTGEEIMLVFV